MTTPSSSAWMKRYGEDGLDDFEPSSSPSPRSCRWPGFLEDGEDGEDDQDGQQQQTLRISEAYRQAEAAAASAASEAADGGGGDDAAAASAAVAISHYERVLELYGRSATPR